MARLWDLGLWNTGLWDGASRRGSSTAKSSSQSKKRQFSRATRPEEPYNQYLRGYLNPPTPVSTPVNHDEEAIIALLLLS